MYSSIKKTLYLVVFVLPFIASCQRDPVKELPAPPASEASTLSLRMQMPTRVLSHMATEQEDRVDDIMIIAFRVDPVTGSEYYDYAVEATSITDVAGETRYKHVTATVFRKDYQQVFVLIANARRDTYSALPADNTSNTPKQDILDAITFTNTEKWHATSLQSFVPLPMWGEAGAVLISEAQQNLGNVKMVRMVSRIDVVISDNEADKVFELRSVHLYNYHEGGRVVPDLSDGNWNHTDDHATAVTVPAALDIKKKGPHAVTGVSGELPAVYTFEATSTDGEKPLEATCIVVGGSYKNGSETFYRLDFLSKDEFENITGYSHLLRNHIYQVNIISVKGNGHETPDEAFESKNINMEAEVRDWEAGDLSDVVFDNQYMLGVSQSYYELFREESDNELFITTDVPEGWKIEILEGNGWLDIKSQEIPTMNGKDEVVFSVDENNGPRDRTARLKVSAGRMSIIITVVQGNKGNLSLEVYNDKDDKITGLLFTSYGVERSSEPQDYYVLWTPVSDNCSVDPVPGTVPFDFGTNDDPTAVPSISSGRVDHTIRPADFTDQELSEEDGGTPFLEKSTRVTYAVGTGADEILRSVLLRHIHYELTASPGSGYRLDGGEYEFIIRTNGEWTVEITGGSHLFDAILTPSGPASPDGYTFRFRSVNDPNGLIDDFAARLTFTYTGEDGRSGQTVVDLTVGIAKPAREGHGSNSYLLHPDGNGIEIPLDWANSDGTSRIKDSENVRIEILWIDASTGVGKPNSVIDSYWLEGDGAAGKIVVYPGPKEGNALIAAYVGNDIRWSWHIWVADYYPDEPGGTIYTTDPFYWMTHNLGALTNEPSDIKSFGLTYQWGRKDPFPALTDLDNLKPHPIYNVDGDEIAISVAEPAATGTIEFSVLHPTHFIKGAGTNLGDWFSTNYDSRNNYLWFNKNGTKSLYDPCPDGWRMPAYEDIRYSPFSNLGSISQWYNQNGIQGGILSVGGWWPAAGYRDGYTGDFVKGEGSATGGYYWSGFPGPTEDYGRGFAITSYANAWHGNSRGNAYNVRCVKDN